MKCIYCDCMESHVLDSRVIENGTVIRRRRECKNCKKRFTTYERAERIPILVIKKDNTREPFNTDKIRNGLLLACQKRPISIAQVNDLVNSVEQTANKRAVSGEINSQIIGELVMKKLKELDEVAYVRFASVYRQFTDIGSFMDELSHLIKENKNK